MRSRLEGSFYNRVTFKGAGAVYVDDSTFRLLRFGGFGMLFSGLPAGVFASSVFPHEPWIGFLAGYGIVGQIGCIAGMCIASVSRRTSTASNILDAALVTHKQKEFELRYEEARRAGAFKKWEQSE